MKKQQWNVAYYAILLLAAVFAVKKAFEPSLVDWEKKLGQSLYLSTGDCRVFSGLHSV
jgi:hypothetical protein